MESNINLNDRVQIVKYLCTGKVRQIGPLIEKKGRFFGIEADTTDERFTDGSYKTERQFECPEQRGVFTNVNDLIPLNTFNKLQDKMKSLTSKYEKLIIEKDNLTVENEHLKKDLVKQQENLKLVISEKNANASEVSNLQAQLETLKNENAKNEAKKQESEKTSNVSNIQIEKQIMKNQDLELALEKISKEKENQEMLVGQYDELTIKKDAEMNTLRDTMRKFVEENERVKKEQEEMNAYLQENQGQLNVHKDKIESSFNTHVNLLKDEVERLALENERYASFANLGLLEHSKHKFNRFMRNFISSITPSIPLFASIEQTTNLEKIVQQKEFCNNYIQQQQLNRREVKQENYSDIDLLKKQFRTFNSIVKNQVYAVQVEWRLCQFRTMPEQEEFTQNSIFKIIISSHSILFEQEFSQNTDQSTIFDNWETIILKEDLEDNESGHESWLIMLRFLFNMMQVLKIYQHLQTDQDNNYWRAVYSFRDQNEQLNGGLLISFQPETADRKLAECNSVFEYFKKIIQSKFTEGIDFSLELFKKISVYDFDSLIKQIFSFISQFQDHAKSPLKYLEKISIQQIPIVAQFVNDQSNFVTNSSKVEANQNELQLIQESMSKQVGDMKEEISKKNKSFDSLSKENEDLRQNIADMEDKVKDLKSELDKFKKKDNGLGANKDLDLETNRGLKLGKTMQFQMDKYYKEKLKGLKMIAQERKIDLIKNTSSSQRDNEFRSQIIKCENNQNKFQLGNVSIIDFEGKSTAQCEEEQHLMVKGLAKQKNDLKQVVEKRKLDPAGKMVQVDAVEKQEKDQLMGTLTFGSGHQGEVQKVQLNEKDQKLLTKMLI